ncbi:hypothetical protein [Sulfurimonas sp.]|uniref:hypothetical protein n=1 Tax=Sulfurimonas sp. TaxID=2022749 RepID=UPI00260A7962|nr:hypothetical protein [Sulfurimonas sp.]MCW8894174.1 hypothetical protein [Sulfurimonas sp.]
MKLFKLPDAMNPSNEDMLLLVAKELGLDVGKFKNDLYSEQIEELRIDNNLF